MPSSEFFFLAVSTAELAPFSISYPSSNSQAVQRELFCWHSWSGSVLGCHPAPVVQHWSEQPCEQAVAAFTTGAPLLLCEFLGLVLGLEHVLGVLCSWPICKSLGNTCVFFWENYGKDFERQNSNTVLSWLP